MDPRDWFNKTAKSGSVTPAKDAAGTPAGVTPSEDDTFAGVSPSGSHTSSPRPYHPPEARSRKFIRRAVILAASAALLFGGYRVLEQDDGGRTGSLSPSGHPAATFDDVIKQCGDPAVVKRNRAAFEDALKVVAAEERIALRLLMANKQPGFKFCEVPLKGASQGIYIKSQNLLVINEAAPGSFSGKLVGLLMMMKNEKEGNLKFDPEWDLATRQQHYFSVMAAPRLAEALYAYNLKDHSVKEMIGRRAPAVIDQISEPWEKFKANPQTTELAKFMETDARRAVEDDVREGENYQMNQRLGLYSWYKLLKSQAVLDEFNNQLLGIYMTEIQDGQHKGAGKALYDVTQQMKLPADTGLVGYFWNAAKNRVADSRLGDFMRRSPDTISKRGHDRTSEAGAVGKSVKTVFGEYEFDFNIMEGARATPQFSRFGTNVKMRQAFAAVEYLRAKKVSEDKSASALDRKIAKSRLESIPRDWKTQGNPYFNADWDKVRADYKAAGYNADLLQLLDKAVPQAKPAPKTPRA